ncbi:MAG: hypothetical protein ACLFO5_00980, partial [Opitutales bacterium]
MRAALCLCLVWTFAGVRKLQAEPLDDLLQRYSEQYHGLGESDGLTSVRIDGSQEQGGRTFSFRLHKKEPDLMRYAWKSENVSVVCGFNGSEGWVRKDTPDAVTSERLSAEEAAVLRAEADFESPLYQHLEKKDVAIELRDPVDIEGRMAHSVEVSDEEDGTLARYCLDPETARVRKYERLDPDGEVVLEVLYKDYRNVEGYPFAFEIETRKDGERVALTSIDDIQLNVGILSFYFDPP